MTIPTPTAAVEARKIRHGANVARSRRLPRPGATLTRSYVHKYRRTRSGGPTWPACPRKLGLVVVNRQTGQVVAARCDRLSCFACIVPRTIAVARALGLARPRQTVTLTLVGQEWSTIRRRMGLFRTALRRLGATGEYCYQVEPNPAGTGNHIHLWWRGDDLADGIVPESARRAGLGSHSFVEDAYVMVNEFHVPALAYGFKMILEGRPEVPTELWPSAELYLRLNGGRLTHTTRAFWTDEKGRSVSIRDAMNAARRGLPGSWNYVGDGQ